MDLQEIKVCQINALKDSVASNNSDFMNCDTIIC